MEFGVRSDVLKENLVASLMSFFGDAADDVVIAVSTDTPYVQIDVEVVVYNFFVVRFLIERTTLFASIKQSGIQLSILKSTLDNRGFSDILASLDLELRLRIPDKYLIANGWITD